MEECAEGGEMRILQKGNSGVKSDSGVPRERDNKSSQVKSRSYRLVARIGEVAGAGVRPLPRDEAAPTPLKLLKLLYLYVLSEE